MLFRVPFQVLATPAQAAFFSISFSPAFISGKAVPPFLPSYLPACSGFLSAIAVRFSSCKGRLPRLIRRLEVHSLQILPFCERVIGRENRRMKPCRQSCTASVKSRNGSGREKNRKKGKKQMFHIKDKRWTRKTVKQANAQNGRLKKS